MEPQKILVFDSDGVLSSGGVPLPKAIDLIAHLNQENSPYYILTNHPLLSAEDKSYSYKKQGFDISPEKIIGAAHPLGEVLKKVPQKTHQIYAIGVEDPTDKLKAMGWSIQLESDDIDAVLLLDDDETWDADRLSYLLNLFLRNPDLPLIAPNPDLVYPNSPDNLYLTTGSWVKLLCELCLQKGVVLNPIYLGKPYAPVYEYLQTIIDRNHPGLNKKSIVMIGDSPGTDILGANQQGWTSVLVETGNHLYGKGQKGCEPDLSYKDLSYFWRECLTK